jgi:hypothetical protein
MAWYPNDDGRDMSESLDRHITGNYGDDDEPRENSAEDREDAEIERAERRMEEEEL